MTRIPIDLVIERIAEKFDLLVDTAPAEPALIERESPQPANANAYQVHSDEPPSSVLAVGGSVDYDSIAFLSGLSANEIHQMHQRPHTYVMGYKAAKALVKAFGITEKQAFGFDEITVPCNSRTRHHLTRLASQLPPRQLSLQHDPHDRNVDGNREMQGTLKIDKSRKLTRKLTPELKGYTPADQADGRVSGKGVVTPLHIVAS